MSLLLGNARLMTILKELSCTTVVSVLCLHKCFFRTNGSGLVLLHLFNLIFVIVAMDYFTRSVLVTDKIVHEVT